MRKKIVLLLLTVLILSLVSVSASRRGWDPGDPYIPCYPFEQIYNYPTTTIPAGQNGSSSVSFDIPTISCPPVKMIQIGGANISQQLDVDAAIIDQPTFQYQCTLSSDQGCCVTNGGSYLQVCASDTFLVQFYDSQGLLFSSGYEGGGCIDENLEFDGRKASRFVVTNRSSSTITVTSTLYTECCYDCRKKQEPPATILYPKVDIENFAVSGGATIINDGKLLTNLTLSPGTQQTFIQIENRGFFTQNDTRIRFDGLPEGVTVSISPETQKLKSQNLATYSATFTVGPNVPSGTYQVTLIAYSERGMFDKITFEFIVP